MNKYDSILGSVGLQKTFFPLTVFSLLKNQWLRSNLNKTFSDLLARWNETTHSTLETTHLRNNYLLLVHVNILMWKNLLDSPVTTVSDNIWNRLTAIIIIHIIWSNYLLFFNFRPVICCFIFHKTSSIKHLGNSVTPTRSTTKEMHWSVMNEVPNAATNKTLERF